MAFYTFAYLVALLTVRKTGLAIFGVIVPVKVRVAPSTLLAIAYGATLRALDTRVLKCVKIWFAFLLALAGIRNESEADRASHALVLAANQALLAINGLTCLAQIRPLHQHKPCFALEAIGRAVQAVNIILAEALGTGSILEEEKAILA